MKSNQFAALYFQKYHSDKHVLAFDFARVVFIFHFFIIELNLHSNGNQFSIRFCWFSGLISVRGWNEIPAISSLSIFIRCLLSTTDGEDCYGNKLKIWISSESVFLLIYTKDVAILLKLLFAQKLQVALWIFLLRIFDFNLDLCWIAWWFWYRSWYFLYTKKYLWVHEVTHTHLPRLSSTWINKRTASVEKRDKVGKFILPSMLPA